MSAYEHDLQPHLRGWEIFQKLWQRSTAVAVAILAGMWLFLV